MDLIMKTTVGAKVFQPEGVGIDYSTYEKAKADNVTVKYIVISKELETIEFHENDA